MSENLLENAIKPDETWPDLIPLDARNLPRLDPSHIPEWAGEYVRALSAATETPPELAAGMVLAACSAVCARHLQIEIHPGYIEPSNLWIVAALPPGNRKSAVQSHATAPMMEWEHQQALEMESEIKRITSERSTIEARINAMRKKAANATDNTEAKTLINTVATMEAELPEVPLPPHIWTSDVTPEKLGSLLASHNECMAWLSSEGGIFDLLQGRYSGGILNLDLVLKAHSGDPDRVDRGSRPSVLLKRPRLSIGLSPQPDVLRGLASKPGFRGRGLLGRCMFLRKTIKQLYG